jgi:hypothetical protein
METLKFVDAWACREGPLDDGEGRDNGVTPDLEQQGKSRDSLR